MESIGEEGRVCDHKKPVEDTERETWLIVARALGALRQDGPHYLNTWSVSKPAPHLLWLLWVRSALGWAFVKGNICGVGGGTFRNITQSNYTSLFM